MTRLYLGALLTLSAVLRFWRLDHPSNLVFDEIYYVDGARDLLSNGVEIKNGAGEFVVHPPLGKWLIAFGIRTFGDNPFGWRFSAALVGTISVALIYLVAQKLFSSDFIALSAALLTTLDGLHLVMSRVALLDIFLMALLLAAFLSFLIERHWLTALFLGSALAVKWSALYFIISLIVYLLFKGNRNFFKYFLLIPITYLFTWIGWFLSDIGYDRNSSSNPMFSLIQYHREIFQFHTSLTSKHPYEASPLTWLYLGRPTSFFYESPQCGGKQCSQEILAMGTPIIWWFGVIALLIIIRAIISRRDKSATLIGLAVAANYLPWLLSPQRTTFYFYAIAFQPFLILAISFAISEFLKSKLGQRSGVLIVHSWIALVALVFIYFLPIYLGTTLTYDAWFSRMWFKSWI
jgi:dolichyl-phosphate-mannose--protein O-mannosyl transferase